MTATHHFAELVITEVVSDVALNATLREGSMMYDAVDEPLRRPAELPAPDVRARLRRARRLTQQEVAEVVGVHRIQVVRWESAGRAAQSSSARLCSPARWPRFAGP